jgi:hypothetical protein
MGEDDDVGAIVFVVDVIALDDCSFSFVSGFSVNG